MSPKQIFQIAGVDGCKAGWFVAITSITMKIVVQELGVDL